MKAVTAVKKVAIRRCTRTPKETEKTSTIVKEKVKTEKVTEKMPEIDDRQCVVDIETLTFKPAHGEWLQMARRGKRFIPGNLRRSQWTGKVRH